MNKGLEGDFIFEKKIAKTLFEKIKLKIYLRKNIKLAPLHCVFVHH
jgi:hypothetical protein